MIQGKHGGKIFAIAFFQFLFWHCSHDQLVGAGKNALPEGYEERYHENMRYGLFVPPTYNQRIKQDEPHIGSYSMNS